MNAIAYRTLAALVDAIHKRPIWQQDSKHRSARTGKSGGTKADRKAKRIRKIAEASRKRNRRS